MVVCADHSETENVADSAAHREEQLQVIDFRSENGQWRWFLIRATITRDVILDVVLSVVRLPLIETFLDVLFHVWSVFEMVEFRVNAVVLGVSVCL